ncbi:MAG: protein phosphatase 2C domain-containing protein [Micrococcales bacterium]|nr:protein phosphatase 2C domain-containing protein [Micrococcales bacterium]MCL2666980.1 protein phosphatase 2C domain-containing protein [Micrococcales bacterium]
MSDDQAVIAGVEVVWAGVTDPGRVRPANEDSVLAAAPVFLVADGMGGYEAGDLASAAVVGAFARSISRSELATLDGVRAALDAANQAVHKVAAGTRRGAGSTLTGAILVEYLGAPHWLVLNVGDSRVYRHMGGTLEQVTVDHSLAQEMLDAKLLTRDDIAGFAESNVITRAMGAADSTADSWLMPVVAGERLLMCSDGLYRELADESIRAALTLSGTPRSAAETLVTLANQAGGRDNITVLIVDVRTGGEITRDLSDTDDIANSVTPRRKPRHDVLEDTWESVDDTFVLPR